MAEAKILCPNSAAKEGNFICGVVEGFYGRPWTTEQRKDLFSKMKKWGMDSYVYAPKDDYKHRAYWRELYTVEEAEHLTGLITSAKERGITFYYAISPGLDITYSSPKEVAALKRKLEQVSQFGCNAFALLFDDIEPEMSEPDKEVFQSFAHAQVSVTNEMYQHLGQPAFLLCPTQYCATRATPNVTNSEYLNTLGGKLPPEVDIMWTGSKVITRTLTPDSIDEITEVLRRPPVIWDNLHANDYDQKRIFLGPYSGRSPDLIPKLRGVLTNPNCEYGANFIAIHTLAQWSRCNVDAIRDPSLNDTVSADIKLETEGASEEGPCGLPPNMYHPRRALKNAINEWLAEFQKSKPAWGPITKPQQIIPTPVPIPIIPSVNTCMSVTNTTTTTTVPMPGVNGNQLHALAEVCCTVSTAVMNSLASETKILPLELKKTCKVPACMEPMDCNMTPGNSPAHSNNPGPNEDAMVDSPGTGKSSSCTMQVEIGSDDTTCSATHMLIDSSNTSLADENSDPPQNKNDKELTYQDLSLLCDLFYLPFEHGGLGVHLLTEFYWLRTNALVLSCAGKSPTREAACRAEVEEWMTRAETFQQMSGSVTELFHRLNGVANRELLHELYPYVWDICGIVSLLNSYVQWLAVADKTSSSSVFTGGQYTWFSKGWKEAFMSGDQEPWAFRGGLTADLQRLLPVDSVTDLFIYRPPEVPTCKIHTVRPYKNSDRAQVYSLTAFKESCCDLPQIFKDLPGDSLIGGFLEINPGLCLVVEDELEVVGYALAAKDVRIFHEKLQPYLEKMALKYPESTEALTDKHKELISSFHQPPTTAPDSLLQQHPSVITAFVSTAVVDEGASKRLLACLLAALRANGCFGAHVAISKDDRSAIEFFSKLGFIDLSPQLSEQTELLYMGRSF